MADPANRAVVAGVLAYAAVPAGGGFAFGPEATIPLMSRARRRGPCENEASMTSRRSGVKMKLPQRDVAASTPWAGSPPT